MVKANWIRDRRSAVISIAILLACAVAITGCPLLWKSTVEDKGNYLKVATGQRSTIKFAVRL
jgi:hypothetical protein